MTITKQYLAYWREHIRPLTETEPNRYLHFTRILSKVGKRFYGVDFALEFSVAIFKDLSEIPSGPVSDTI